MTLLLIDQESIAHYVNGARKSYGLTYTNDQMNAMMAEANEMAIEQNESAHELLLDTFAEAQFEGQFLD